MLLRYAIIDKCCGNLLRKIAARTNINSKESDLSGSRTGSFGARQSQEDSLIDALIGGGRTKSPDLSRQNSEFKRSSVIESPAIIEKIVVSTANPVESDLDAQNPVPGTPHTLKPSKFLKEAHIKSPKATQLQSPEDNNMFRRRFEKGRKRTTLKLASSPEAQAESEANSRPFNISNPEERPVHHLQNLVVGTRITEEGSIPQDSEAKVPSINNTLPMETLVNEKIELTSQNNMNTLSPLKVPKTTQEVQSFVGLLEVTNSNSQKVESNDAIEIAVPTIHSRDDKSDEVEKSLNNEE